MKRLYFNIKDRKVLTLGLCLILVCVFTLTVAYAALNAVLTIQGNAEITASTWDIHLENPVVKSGSATADVPTITSGRTLTFNTTLNMPGDYYEFTVDVVNSGSIDAMIDKITKTPELTADQAKYLKYEVSYANGESISTKQTIGAGVTMPLKVRVEYRKDLSNGDLPTEQVVLNLSLVLDYIQSDGSGSSVIGNGKMFSTNGNLNDIGTIVTIGSEQFYTIGTEGDNVKLFSMYNLFVGNETMIDENDELQLVPIANPTGLQSSEAVGIRIDSNGEYLLPFKGLVAYAGNGIHGTNLSDYSGSIIESYVNDYKITLESMGVNVESIRLITKDELVNTLGCNDIEHTCTGSNYPWVYSTYYWTGTASNEIYIWYVSSNGYFDTNYYLADAGVRPVIVISKEYFE